MWQWCRYESWYVIYFPYLSNRLRLDRFNLLNGDVIHTEFPHSKPLLLSTNEDEEFLRMGAIFNWVAPWQRSLFLSYRNEQRKSSQRARTKTRREKEAITWNVTKLINSFDIKFISRPPPHHRAVILPSLHLLTIKNFNFVFVIPLVCCVSRSLSGHAINSFRWVVNNIFSSVQPRRWKIPISTLVRCRLTCSQVDTANACT